MLDESRYDPAGHAGGCQAGVAALECRLARFFRQRSHDTRQVDVLVNLRSLGRSEPGTGRLLRWQLSPIRSPSQTP